MIKKTKKCTIMTMKTEYAQAFLVLSIFDLIFFCLSIQIVWFSGLAYVAALGESLF